ncbi:kinase phosphorylation protein-domain-containing protein [Mycena rebaudengoi]|nr:kinase phosphorylation protein-domain-containing protein [Mycena rebaudengoi]
MFEPIREGTRGGQAEFKWADVSADKDRENYLGHSINAPTGRWQKNKDVHWYNRDLKQGEAERAEEIRKIKEAEADALAVALGFEPAPKTLGGPTSAAAPPASASSSLKGIEATDPELAEKAERRRKKAERKEEKRARKEKRRAEKEKHITDGAEADYDDRRRRDRSRSRSPPRRRTSKDRDFARRIDCSPTDRSPRRPDRSPRRLDRDRSPTRRPDPEDYVAVDRENERDRDRRRWDSNSARREQPGAAQWGRR